MLTLVVPSKEFIDEKTNELVRVPGTTLNLEHSLLSLSKWEAKWHKPFMSDKPLSIEETIDYVRCMSINKNVDPLVYETLSNEDLITVINYIKSPATATWFSKDDDTNKVGSKSNEAVTAEIIYYWMIALQIPFECEKWHLSKLLTLIKVCNIKNQGPKRTSQKDFIAKRNALNAKRKAGKKG